MMEWQIPLLVFFIGAALLLYIVLGGADYGAGILEILPSGKWKDKQRDLINHAMGPVWEANHIWLILLVVILFTGFPPAFHYIVTSLHIPIVALLIGIIVRGAVFTFRHYDAIKDPTSQNVYTWMFSLSSAWTSVWLGIIAASLFRGTMTPPQTDFWTSYMAPWWGAFPLVVGLFVAFNFSYLASIYLIGETHDKDFKRFFSRRAFLMNTLVITTGGMVFAVSFLNNETLHADFFTHPLSLLCMLFATVCFGVLWLMTKREYPFLTRCVAAAQTSLILLGWYFAHAPYMLITTQGPMSFSEAAAPPAVLTQLCVALLVGSLFIFPSLYFLLRVFKSDVAKS